MENLKYSNMNSKKKSGAFQQAWNRRKQWQKENKAFLPDNATLLHMAEVAQRQPQFNATIDLPNVRRKRNRWIPYAAAASLIAGISIIGITRSNHHDGRLNLPVAKEVSVDDGQTVRFLCNDGCTANEVLLASKDVISNN